MSDDLIIVIISGILGIVATSIGTVMGICLSQYLNNRKEAKERKNARSRLIIKLFTLGSSVKAILNEVEDKKVIKTSDDLKNINKILKKALIEEKIKSIIDLSEKTIPSEIESADLKNLMIFTKIERIRINIGNLFLQTYANETEEGNYFTFDEDIKPKLIRFSKEIIDDCEFSVNSIYEIDKKKT